MLIFRVHWTNLPKPLRLIPTLLPSLHWDYLLQRTPCWYVLLLHLHCKTFIYLSQLCRPRYQQEWLQWQCCLCMGRPLLANPCWYLSHWWPVFHPCWVLWIENHCPWEYPTSPFTPFLTLQWHKWDIFNLNRLPTQCNSNTTYRRLDDLAALSPELSLYQSFVDRLFPRKVQV